MACLRGPDLQQLCPSSSPGFPTLQKPILENASWAGRACGSEWKGLRVPETHNQPAAWAGATELSQELSGGSSRPHAETPVLGDPRLRVLGVVHPRQAFACPGSARCSPAAPYLALSLQLPHCTAHDVSLAGWQAQRPVHGHIFGGSITGHDIQFHLWGRRVSHWAWSMHKGAWSGNTWGGAEVNGIVGGQ